jgi:hypothetical protein
MRRNNMQKDTHPEEADNGMITQWDHGWLLVYCNECDEWGSATNDKDEAADIYDSHLREIHVRTL